MSRLTNLTFVIGAQTAEQVGSQLRRTCRTVDPVANSVWHREAPSLADLFHRRLIETPHSFDLDLPAHLSDPLRFVWTSSKPHAGLLLAIQHGQLKTINLFIGRACFTADALALKDLEQLLHPIPAYRACFDLIRAAPLPLMATFCCASGGLNDQIEAAILAFAAVYLSRSDAPSGNSRPYPAQSAVETSNRAL